MNYLVNTCKCLQGQQKHQSCIIQYVFVIVKHSLLPPSFSSKTLNLLIYPFCFHHGTKNAFFISLSAINWSTIMAFKKINKRKFGLLKAFVVFVWGKCFTTYSLDYVLMYGKRTLTLSMLCAFYKKLCSCDSS